MGSIGRRRIQYLIVAVGVLGAVWLGYTYIFPDHSRNQESAEHLRNVLTTEDSREARAAAAALLGEMRDEQSMPELLQAMEDPDPLIRGRAAAAVRKIMGADYYFRAEGSPARRKEVLAIIKRDWEGYLKYKTGPAAASSASRGAPQ